MKVDGASGPAMDVGKKNTSEPWPSRDLKGMHSVSDAIFVSSGFKDANHQGLDDITPY